MTTTIETITSIYNSCLAIMLDETVDARIERRAYTIVLACRRAYGLSAAEQSAIVSAALAQVTTEIVADRAVVSESTSRGTVRRVFDNVAEAIEWASAATFAANTAVRLFTKTAQFDRNCVKSYADTIKVWNRTAKTFA